MFEAFHSPLCWLSLFNLYIHEKTSSAYSLPQLLSIQTKIFLQQGITFLPLQSFVHHHSINRTDCSYLPGDKKDRRSAIIGYGERAVFADKFHSNYPHAYSVPSTI